MKVPKKEVKYTEESAERWAIFMFFFAATFFVSIVLYTKGMIKWLHKDEHLVTSIVMRRSTASPLADIIQIGFTTAGLIFFILFVSIVSWKLIVRRVK